MSAALSSEQAWAGNNLATAVALQGDPRRGWAIAEEATEHCRVFRIDVLPFLVESRVYEPTSTTPIFLSIQGT